jgi:hypothetical protein
MTAYHSLRLFQIVSKYIPNQNDSRDFVTEVEAVVRNQLQMETNTLATKSELFQVKDELRKEIHQFRDELKGDIHALREELKGDIHALRDELKGDIYRLEVRMELGFKDQLKWIILLMLGFSSLIITVVKFL